METINCPRCGRVFTKINKSICPACVKEDDDIFEKVRGYVKENPNRTISEVSAETEVPMKRIMHYIRDGRLEISTGMSSDVGCTQCGKPIKSGRFCEKCALDIKTNILTKPPSKPKPKPEVQTSKGRMHLEQKNK